MEIRKTLINYFYVLFGGGLARGAALINSIIVARMLGPSQFGEFSIFYFVMILTWQFPEAFDVVFVTHAKRVDSLQEKNAILKSALLFKLAFLAFLLVLSYPLSYALATFVFQKNTIVNLLMTAMLCGGAVTFLNTIASIFLEKERFILSSSVHSVFTVLILICLLVLKIAHIEPSLEIVIRIFIAASLISGAASVAILCKRVGNLFIIDKVTLHRSFSEGKWMLGVAVVLFLFSRLDILFLTRYLDFESLGIYSVAAQLVTVMGLATGALAGISMPKASAAIRSRQSFRTFVKESFSAIVFIEAGIALFIVAAPLIVTMMYGGQYTAASSILRVLLYGWFFSVVFIPFSFVFYSLGDAQTRFYLELLKLGTGAILLYWLVPLYGLIGGAYAMTLTLLIATGTSLAVLRYRLTRTYRTLCLC